MGDILVIRAQCAGKYTEYTRSLTIRYFRYPTPGMRPLPGALQRYISTNIHR